MSQFRLNWLKDDYSVDNFNLSKRVLKDWLHSLRYHSHSPYSSLLAFELLTTAEEEGEPASKE